MEQGLQPQVDRAIRLSPTQPGGVAYCECAAVEEEDVSALATEGQEGDTAAPALKNLQRGVARGKGTVLEARLLLCIPQTNTPVRAMNIIMV